jgi:hypothetical protein
MLAMGEERRNRERETRECDVVLVARVRFVATAPRVLRNGHQRARNVALVGAAGTIATKPTLAPPVNARSCVWPRDRRAARDLAIVTR